MDTPDGKNPISITLVNTSTSFFALGFFASLNKIKQLGADRNPILVKNEWRTLPENCPMNVSTATPKRKWGALRRPRFADQAHSVYRPVSACGLIRVGGERTRPVVEWVGYTAAPPCPVWLTSTRSCRRRYCTSCRYRCAPACSCRNLRRDRPRTLASWPWLGRPSTPCPRKPPSCFR